MVRIIYKNVNSKWPKGKESDENIIPDGYTTGQTLSCSLI